MTGLSNIIYKVDSFDPIPSGLGIYPDYHIYKKVWKEAGELRRSGKLLDIVKGIKTRITVIHGDYDPHPYSAVWKTFLSFGKDIRLELIKECGHYP